MALVAVAIAAAMLFDGRDLTPGVLEPVGPGTIPNATCWIVIALALAMLVRSVWGGGDGQASASLPDERWRDMAVLLGVTFAYVAVLGFALVRYSIATAVFLLLTVLWLAPRRRRALPATAAIALVLGFGLDYIFRHVLVTDLP